MVITEMVGLPVAQAQINVVKEKEIVTVIMTALAVWNVGKAVDLMTIVIPLLGFLLHMTAAMTQANVIIFSFKGFWNWTTKICQGCDGIEILISLFRFCKY